ncbi:hypothetical protein DUI87_00216 [Hirundo rustica rustica]|uniref:Ig-like domain-containing protein n=1 Tax=Hirundo rustica rustica TaxID=333673 RepID=A0A3M0LBX0_HIRRU|nr:hypothetical protein DUI87_00216 [Hirundo rustica rustica]
MRRLLGVLKNLDLSHNRLADFPWQDLRGLGALQILKLSNNRLSSVPRGALAGLRELRSLWLNDNQLATLPARTFEALPALAQLQLFRNPFNCSCKLFWLKEWALSAPRTSSRAPAPRCMAVAVFGKEDEGTYTCLAVNEVGTREASVEVALAGSRGPPPRSCPATTRSPA